jgi:hypothetical protein
MNDNSDPHSGLHQRILRVALMGLFLVIGATGQAAAQIEDMPEIAKETVCNAAPTFLDMLFGCGGVAL